MKKYLSFLLALLMVLSTVSFAAPTMVGVAGNVSEEPVIISEATEPEAELSAEENLGQLIAKVDFENLDAGKVIGNGTMIKHIGYVAENRPEGFPAEISIYHPGSTSTTLTVTEEKDEAGNVINKYGLYNITDNAAFPKIGFVARTKDNTADSYFPAGSYTIKTTYTADTVAGSPVTAMPVTPGVLSYYRNLDGYTSEKRCDKLLNLRGDSTNTYGYIVTNEKSGATDTVTGTITHTYDDEIVMPAAGSVPYKFAGFSHFITMIGKDKGNPATYKIDNMELYYKPLVFVTDIEFYDVRKGYMDITVERPVPEITAQNASKVFIKSANHFDAACDVINNEDGSVTYRLYEDAYLLNQEISLNGTYQASDCAVVIGDSQAGTKHKYTSVDMTNYDGENMMANGDFSNPYYIGVVRSSDNNDVKITEDGLVTTMEKTATPNNNMQLQAVPLALGKYFVEFEINHLTNSITPIDGSSYRVSLYMPFPNNDGSYSIGSTHYSNPAHIPSATVGSGFTVNATTLKNNTKHTVINRRVLDLSDESKLTNNKGALIPIENFATYPFCFQVCPQGTYLYKKPHPTQTNADGTPKMVDACYGDKVEGLSFAVKYFSVKKMFEASFTDGTNTEVLDIAKDVEFILPETLGGKKVYGWILGDTMYAAGSRLTPDKYVEEGITFTAVDSLTPINEQKTSIRTDEHSGVRFLASVTEQQRNDLAEYGFIVTRKTILDGKNLAETDLTFDLPSNTYVAGTSYDKANNIDKIYAQEKIEGSDFNHFFFTGVVTGIPENKYDDKLVVRPYSKATDGTYFYGDISVASVLDVIKKIRDGGYTVVTEEQKTFCKQVLVKYGEYTEETEEGYVMFEDDVESGNWFGMAQGYNCTLSLVEDPTDSSNHVYYITNRTDVENASSKLHSYIWTPAANSAKFTVKENASYKFVCDIYVTDKDMDGNTIQKATMSGALDFNNKSKAFSGSINSTVYPFNWTKVEKVGKLCYTGTDTNTDNNWALPDFRTNPAPADTNSGLASPKARFGIYSNPINDVGVSFYVDNIKLIKLK